MNVSALAAEVMQLKATVAQRDTDLNEVLNTVWLLFTSSLVFFMQCGFGMLEAGAVRSKATQSIMLKNLFDVSLGGVLWWLVGYGFTNGGGNPFIGVTGSTEVGSYFASSGLTDADGPGDPPPASGVAWSLIFFQFTFAATAATIVSGAVAERAQLPAYLAFSSVTTAIIYPTVAHWCWSTSGWLAVSNPDALLGGVLDFAGSGVVHMTGGVAAFAGAKIIGPRVGRFDDSGHVVPMHGHSSVLQVLGTFILWLGWYGFNMGSTLGMNVNSARTAGRTVLTTTLSGAAGGITSVSMERFAGRARAWEVDAMCNGILAGLVSITAGCATVLPWASLIIGVIGGLIYRFASRMMLKNKIDDPLDAFAVHGACGCWGLISAALFSTPSYALAVSNLDEGGLFYGGPKMLGAVTVFLIAHFAWVGSLSFFLFWCLKKLGLLRVPNHVHLATLNNSGGVKGESNADDASTHGGSPFIPAAAAAAADPSAISVTSATTEPMNSDSSVPHPVV